MSHSNLRLTSLGTTELAVTKHSTFHEGPTHSVLATRRTVNGKDTVQAIPGSESSRVLVDHAVREGLLIQTGPGTYIDTGSQR